MSPKIHHGWKWCQVWCTGDCREGEGWSQVFWRHVHMRISGWEETWWVSLWYVTAASFFTSARHEQLKMKGFLVGYRYTIGAGLIPKPSWMAGNPPGQNAPSVWSKSPMPHFGHEYVKVGHAFGIHTHISQDAKDIHCPRAERSLSGRNH